MHMVCFIYKVQILMYLRQVYIGMRLQSKEPSFLIYEIPRGPAARGEKNARSFLVG